MVRLHKTIRLNVLVIAMILVCDLLRRGRSLVGPFFLRVLLDSPIWNLTSRRRFFPKKGQPILLHYLTDKLRKGDIDR